MLCLSAVVGGSGCSTVAAGAALLAAERGPTLLVDLAGDQAALLGLTNGIADLDGWLGAEDRAPDGLRRLEQPIGDRLSLLAVEDSSGAFGRGLDLLASVLADESRQVIVDLGRIDGRRATPELGQFLDRAARSIVVTRACYLSLRRVSRLLALDGLVLVVEPNRALTRRDVQGVIDAPVLATVPWDPRLARSVDAGTMLARGPRLLRSLEPLL